jgi:hypothetical protein
MVVKQLLEIPFDYARCSWILVFEAVSGQGELLRDGTPVGTLRYDPDLGFGPVPPTLQPLLIVLREVLAPFDERIRFLQRAV